MCYESHRTIFIILAMFLIVIATTAEQVKTKNFKQEIVKTKVIILGAGVSAISAASTLYRKNITDFLILEAQSHVGGRAKAVNWNGLKIEAGANWIHHIHDVDSRPLMKLKKLVGLKGKMSNYSDIAIR